MASAGVSTVLRQTNWVVLELSSQGEAEDPDVLLEALKKPLSGAEIFIPASISIVGDSRIVHKLIDNYVFVRRTLPDTTYFRLEGTKYVSAILTTTIQQGSRYQRQIAGVSDRDIDKMRRQIHIETEQGIEVGDEVQVMSGPYRGINGKVVEDILETSTVQVYIKLRSKQTLISLPRSFVRFVAKDSAEVPTFSPFGTKVQRIREWLSQVKPILFWGADQLAPIASKHQRASYLDHLSDRGSKLFSFVRTMTARDLDGQPMQDTHDRLVMLESWVGRGNSLFQSIQALRRSTDLTPIETKFTKLQWLQGMLHRAEDLVDQVHLIEKALMEYKPNMIENVVVDGMNLAHRVDRAMALKAPLTDKEGNPTGLVYGFLNSLGALKKRFPNALFHVCWDGSTQRRLAIYPEYKAGRVKKDLGPQIDQIKAILCAIGVAQVTNPEEEADDLVACLLRGPLKGQRNVIVSTDRDYLQLVTYTDVLLVPKSGARQEILYDVDKVISDYGVHPTKIGEWKALVGDESDNIRGVPSVPTKVLTSLLKDHGTVEAIFASNLAGVTPYQYEKIRAAEAQVRLNLSLTPLLPNLTFENQQARLDVKFVADYLETLSIQVEPLLAPFLKKAKGFAKGS